MNYLFDTNVLIDFFHGKEKVVKKIQEIGSDNGAISVITMSEIYHGAYKTQTPERYIVEFEHFLREFAIKILPVDNNIAKLTGKLQGELAKSHIRLTGFDAVISATALWHEYTLVTNDKIFQKIKHLSLERIIN